ncbi:hypothetical protein QFC20_006053 [Naganishia adeliensis]|uniref:Uncharacterized protein n=1 Tax=Naganishia adeliensis TaxID=92952 RepID=A0ACC2VGG0_9TREE|nr:hypothetical protein QFC20_006053 [Naganishia adeliensis]
MSDCTSFGSSPPPYTDVAPIGYSSGLTDLDTEFKNSRALQIGHKAWLYKQCMDNMRMLFEQKGKVLKGEFQWSSDPDMIFKPYETAYLHQSDLNALDQDMDILAQLNETTADFTDFIQQFDPNLAVKIKNLSCRHRDAYFKAYREFRNPEWLGERLAEGDIRLANRKQARKAAFDRGYQSMMHQMSYHATGDMDNESTNLLSRPTFKEVTTGSWSRSISGCLSCFQTTEK